ncbi:MAG: DUF4430 domain-containing protein [Oscillospiraceae bacterium]
MKKVVREHKGGIIAAIIAIAVLTTAFFWGGDYSKKSGPEKSEAEVAAAMSSTSGADMPSSGSTDVSSDNTAASAEAETKASQDAVSGNTAKPSPNQGASEGKAGETPANENNNAAAPPSEHPAPVNPQDSAISDTQETCTLSVSCAVLLDNMTLLSKEKWALVPASGTIFAGKTVTFYEGESVFNLLSREMKNAGIQMEFVNTPMYSSAYIEGIGNLYEFDAGELSGWVYEVNGWFPNYGCSLYKLHDGDIVRWLYTCDLGKDVGGNNSTGS